MKQYDPDDPFAQGVIEGRVKLGMELLDEHYYQWEDAINLDILDLEDTADCILGQIGGNPEFSGKLDYHGMLPIMFAHLPTEASMSQAVADHGFDIRGGGDHWAKEYKALTTTWRADLEGRKNDE